MLMGWKLILTTFFIQTSHWIVVILSPIFPLKVMIHILLPLTQGKVVLVYVKNAFDTIQRADLSTQHAQFESTWIEIKNKKSKNICGCIYRHPLVSFGSLPQIIHSTRVTRHFIYCYR